MPAVYILQSCCDGRLYIGSTINLEERLKHHEGVFTPTTKRFGRRKTVFPQEYSALKEARYIEKRLKVLKEKTILKKLLKMAS